MLSLESPKWIDLDHAYGSASDLPALLKAVGRAPVRQNSDAEPWFSLWSTICHQGDVYSASYAAVPHIVSAAARRKPEDRAEYFWMAGMVEAMRHRTVSPAIPIDLKAAYEQALSDAIPILLESIAVEEDQGWFKALLSALAAFRGFPELAAGLGDLESKGSCPKCEQEFALPGFDLFEPGANGH